MLARVFAAAIIQKPASCRTHPFHHRGVLQYGPPQTSEVASNRMRCIDVALVSDFNSMRRRMGTLIDYLYRYSIFIRIIEPWQDEKVFFNIIIVVDQFTPSY